jgi:Lrp/AsnC family leucine-responsive transcriptional regulator
LGDNISIPIVFRYGSKIGFLFSAVLAKNMKSNRSKPSSPEGSLDRIDLGILRVLREDSRKTLQEIGDSVGLSPTSCWTRIKRLEAEGVIKRYTVDLDPVKLGYRDFVIVQLTLESHSEETLYEFGRVLATIPEIQEAYLVSGDYDYYIRIAVRDTRDYERLLREKLYKIPGIRHSKSHFVLRVLKEASVPLTG